MRGLRRGLGAFVLVPFALFAASCGSSGGDPTDPGGPGQTPAIASVSLSASSLNVPAGSSGEVTVTVSRSGGFAGAVNVTADAPAGVTVQPLTIQGNATSGVLTIQVAQGTAAGTLQVTIQVTGTGVEPATSTLSLVVAAAVEGDFSLSLSPGSLEFAQGGNASTSVTITRSGGFAGPVSLAVEGLPQGVTATFDPNPATGNTSTLSLAAGAAAVVGGASLTVRGEATGVSSRTASLGLTIAATGGGGTGNVTWAFCEETGIPVWVAAQDGNGPWTRVQGNAQNVFSFQIDSDRGGLAYVTLTGQEAHTQVFYYSREEFLAIGADQCDGVDGTKTVNGSVSGLGDTDMAFITLGSASTEVVAMQSTNFTLNNVVDGPQDLLASRVQFDLQTFSLVNDRMVLRRGLNPANNSTLPVIDFDGEGFAPASANVTVAGLAGGEDAVVVGIFTTAHGGMGSYSASLTPGSVHTYTGLPGDRLETGDMHYLQISTTNLTQGAGEQPPDTRGVGLAFRNVEDRTATLGPQLALPTITTGGGSAPLLRAQWPLQAEYSQFVFAVFNQEGTGSGQGRTVTLGASNGFLAGMNDADLAAPDLSGVSGWAAAWNLQTGVNTRWTVSGSGWELGGGGMEVHFPHLVDGTRVFSATRSGQITP